MEGCGAWLGSPGKGLGSPSLITLGSAKAHLWTCRDLACAGAVPVALGFLPGGCTPCMLIAPSACCPPSRLKRSGLKVRFCTNESQKARGALVGLLRQMGFTISEGEVTAPAPAACLILRERGLRPHLLVHEGGPAGLGTLPGGSCGWALPFYLGHITGEGTGHTGSCAGAHRPGGGNLMGFLQGTGSGRPQPHTRGSLEEGPRGLHRGEP